MASARARSGAHGWFGHPRGNPAQVGNLRRLSHRAAIGASWRRRTRSGHRGALHHRNHLRGAYLLGAERCEEARRLQLSEPSRLLHARTLLAQLDRRDWFGHVHDQPRPVDGRALPLHRHDLRALSHQGHGATGRPLQEDAHLVVLHGVLHPREPRPSRPQWLHR